MRPAFFPTSTALRSWFENNHAKSKEIWIGFYKKNSGKPSITWPVAVDQALCFGWIDGVRKRIDDLSYTIRFTRRKPTSIWSTINIKRAKELIDQKLMTSAGLQAFEKRDEERSEIYSYERKNTVKLPAEYEARLGRNRRAWKFFQSQPPWYRRTASYWVTSAKKEETRANRLAKLIADSENGRTIPPLTRPRSKRSRLRDSSVKTRNL